MNDILILIWLHFVADFLLQSDKVATNKNKSKSNRVLTHHCFIYSLPFVWVGVWFAVVNAFLHFIVDWVTSRVTYRLFQAEERHWFFVVIGLDQAIHLTALLITYSYFTEVLWV